MAYVRMFLPAALLLCSILFSVETEEKMAKRIYAHLLIRDPSSAVQEAKESLDIFPQSKSLQFAMVRALCDKGEERMAIEQMKQIISSSKEELYNRSLLEVVAWGVLNKGYQSSQMMVRVNSLLGAAFTKDAKAIPLLLEQLQGSNAVLRSLAAHLSAEYGDEPLKRELARLLKEEKVWYVRLEVIKAIGQLRMRECETELKEIIGNPKTLLEEKGTAILSLVNMYEKVDKEELASLIRSDRAGLRQLACQIVSYLDLKEYTKEMIALLKDNSPDIRMHALTTLGLLQIKNYEGRPLAYLVSSHLSDSAPEVAITAAWLMMLHGDKKGAGEIEKWIEDPDPEWRRLSSAALAVTGKIGVPLSIKMLKKSDDPYVQANLSIGLMGQRESVALACDKLYGVLSSQKGVLWMWDSHLNPLFRSLSPSQLKHIDQIPHYPAVMDQLVRLDLLSALSIMRYPKAQEAVKGFLQNQTWGTTGAAATTLLEEGDEEALNVVRELLKDPDEMIRVQAALMLALLGSDVSAVPILQEAYFHLDREMKVHVLEAIGHIGDPQSIPFLIEQLQEPFQMLRVVAASALIQCIYH